MVDWKKLKIRDRVLIHFNGNSACRPQFSIDTVAVEVVGIDTNIDTDLPLLVCPIKNPEKFWDIFTFDSDVACYCSSFNEDFFGKQVIWINPSCIEDTVSSSVKVMEKTGKSCIHCFHYNEYAVANMVNNEFCCFSCRSTEGWRYRDRLL